MEDPFWLLILILKIQLQSIATEWVAHFMSTQHWLVQLDALGIVILVLSVL